MPTLKQFMAEGKSLGKSYDDVMRGVDIYKERHGEFDEEFTAPPMDFTNLASSVSDLPPEDRKFIEQNVSEEEYDFNLSKQFYENKTNTIHTPEMVQAQIDYEYGEGTKAKVANEKNNLFKDTIENTGRITAGAMAQMPKLRAEMGQFRENLIDDISKKFGLSPKQSLALKATTTPKNPLATGLELSSKTWGLIPTDKLQEWGAEQVEKAGEIQSEHMSGVPLEDSVKSGDWESAGKDVATAIAFESPRMAIQIALGLISPEASLEYMFITSAGSKRAEKTEEDSIYERVLAPLAVGATEVLTEKLLGTQRIIDKAVAGKFKTGAANRFKQILTDMTGGAISEMGATFGENVVDRLSGEEVELTRGLAMAGTVGAIMDVGAGQIMTLGDANRMRKQNTDAEIDAMVQERILTEEQGEVVKTPEGEREAAVNSYNQELDEPSAEEQKVSEEAMGTMGKIQERGREVVEQQQIETAPEVEGLPQVVGISKAENAVIREALDLEQLPDADKKAQTETLQNAKDKGMEADASDLVSEVLNKPRALNDEEVGSLLLRKATITNEIEHLYELRNEALEDGETELANDLNARIVSKLESMDRLTRASKLAGTEMGRALASLAMRIDRKSFDLVSIMNEAQTMKGEDLTQDERKKFEDLEKRLKELEEQLKNLKGKELIKARAKAVGIKREINDALRALRPMSKKELLWELYDIPRTAKLTMDVGHLYRQGGFFIANPRKVNPFKFIGITFKAAFSQEGADAINSRIQESEYYDEAKIAGLHFIEEGQKLNEREQVITNNILERIPGVGAIIKGSARTQVTSLNWLRMTLYEGYAARHPDMSVGQSKEVAEAMNVLTGYGVGKTVATVAPVLDKMVTSTRFTASRVQSLGVIPKYWNNKALRNELIEDTLWFWGWRLALMGLAKWVMDDEGWEFGSNPQHHTYGKLMVPLDNGTTRIYDPFAGFQQLPYRAAGLIGGDVKPADFVGSFLASKESPSLAAVHTIAWGKKYPNEDIPRWEAALRAISPISLEGVIDSVVEDTGAWDMAFASTLDAIGINSYTMETKEIKKQGTEGADFIQKIEKKSEKRKKNLNKR